MAIQQGAGFAKKGEQIFTHANKGKRQARCPSAAQAGSLCSIAMSILSRCIGNRLSIGRASVRNRDRFDLNARAFG